MDNRRQTNTRAYYRTRDGRLYGIDSSRETKRIEANLAGSGLRSSNYRTDNIAGMPIRTKIDNDKTCYHGSSHVNFGEDHRSPPPKRLILRTLSGTDLKVDVHEEKPTKVGKGMRAVTHKAANGAVIMTDIISKHRNGTRTRETFDHKGSKIEQVPESYFSR